MGMGNQSTSGNNGSLKPLLLYLLQLPLPVCGADCRKGSLTPNNKMESPCPDLCLWQQRLSDPWAGLLLVCMLLPQTLVPCQKMGMKVFHRQGEKKCHELLLTQGLWEITCSWSSVAPHYSELLRSTTTLTLWAQSKSIILKTIFFPPYADEVPRVS